MMKSICGWLIPANFFQVSYFVESIDAPVFYKKVWTSFIIPDLAIFDFINVQS